MALFSRGLKAYPRPTWSSVSWHVMVLSCTAFLSCSTKCFVTSLIFWCHSYYFSFLLYNIFYKNENLGAFTYLSLYKLRSEYIDLFLKPHLGDAGRRSLILINIHFIYLLSVNSVNWCCCAKICFKIPGTASFALHANELPYKSRVYMVWPELIARGVSFLCRAKNNCASVEEYLRDYVNIYTRRTRRLFLISSQNSWIPSFELMWKTWRLKQLTVKDRRWRKRYHGRQRR